MADVINEGTLYRGNYQRKVKFMSDGSIVGEVLHQGGIIKEVTLTDEELKSVEKTLGEDQIKRFPMLMFWKACIAGTHKWGQNYV